MRDEGFGSYDLTGKVMIVTGGGSGIGKATAKLLARRGAAVMIAARREAELAATVEDIDRDGGRGAYICTDVTSESDVKAMVDATVSRFGGLHGAFNGVGMVSAAGPLHEMSLSEFERQLRINVTSVALCMKFQIAHMLREAGGSIVNVGSGASLLGVQGVYDYCASKHAVVGLTKAASADYAARGVRVNALLPGNTRTDMLARHIEDPAMLAAMKRTAPIDRIAEPEEVAEVAAFLLSDGSSFMTGSSVSVDGGITSWIHA